MILEPINLEGAFDNRARGEKVPKLSSCARFAVKEVASAIEVLCAMAQHICNPFHQGGSITLHLSVFLHSLQMMVRISCGML